jgi:hypothetical protein
VGGAASSRCYEPLDERHRDISPTIGLIRPRVIELLT